MRTSAHLIVTHIVRKLADILTYFRYSYTCRKFRHIALIFQQELLSSAGTTFHRRTSLLPPFPLGTSKTADQSFLFFHNVHGSTSRLASYSTGTGVVSRGSRSRGVKLTTYLQPVASWRITGHVLHSPYGLKEWRGTILSLQQVAGPRCWHITARTHMKCGKGKSTSRGNATPRMPWRHTSEWSYRPIHFELRYSVRWVISFTRWPL